MKLKSLISLTETHRVWKSGEYEAVASAINDIFEKYRILSI